MSDCSGDAYRTNYWNSSSYNFRRGFVSCDYDDSCDYFQLSVYNDTSDDDCDGGNLVSNFPIVVDECVSFGNESYGYSSSCDDDSATRMEYNCNDSDDDCLVNETNLVDMYSNRGYCVQVEQCCFWVFCFVFFLLRHHVHAGVGVCCFVICVFCFFCDQFFFTKNHY